MGKFLVFKSGLVHGSQQSMSLIYSTFSMLVLYFVVKMKNCSSVRAVEIWFVPRGLKRTRMVIVTQSLEKLFMP